MTESTVHRRDVATSTAWIVALRTHGPAHDEARLRLYELLLRATRFEMTRRQATLPRESLDALARSAADQSFVVTLAMLDQFRGVSRFTTWASKFALREARKTAMATSANGTHEPEGHLHG